ncbi:MAG: hypothetical protein H6564_23650 [Lewinellaceae bacterium]|nr:hypothetical protein [Lewinellaceae bacterium]
MRKEIVVFVALSLCACKRNAENQQAEKEPQQEVSTEKIENTADTAAVTVDDTVADSIQPGPEAAPVPSGKASFNVKSSTVFQPQNKKVVLMEDSLSQKLILFQTTLQVNTDGTPLSYHPQDLGGKTKALNTIGNAVAIYKNGESGNIFLKRGFYSEAMSVFEQFRDSDYEKVPDGYKIKWQNVLIPEKTGSVEKPCIFKSGKYQGYYASATSLQNGLTSNKGECNCNNQVNPLEIPALVLVGGKDNPLWKYGARVADLLIAYNPENGAVSYAIINDTGPNDKLGEGSVLLNMQLNKTDVLPKNRKDTYGLVTKNDVIIAMIPASGKYKVERPFTADNIKNRITSWLIDNGFSGEADFVQFLQKQESGLK